jgi:hypothetical protein
MRKNILISRLPHYTFILYISRVDRTQISTGISKGNYRSYHKKSYELPQFISGKFIGLNKLNLLVGNPGFDFM